MVRRRLRDTVAVVDFSTCLGYIEDARTTTSRDTPMKVSEILKVKGNILYTVTPDTPMIEAVNTMAEKDIGSLVVMEFGELVGMLSFREVMKTIHENHGEIGKGTVRKHMDDHPITITPETEINEVRRLMLERHARYVPVLDFCYFFGVM